MNITCRLIKFRLIIAVSLLLVNRFLFSQEFSAGINIESPNPNAVLHLVSPNNDQGLLIPKLNNAQRDGMSLDLEDKGLMVFDEQDDRFYFWDGITWVVINVGNSNVLTSVATNSTLTGDGVAGTELGVNVGTGAEQIVQLDGSGNLPALDAGALRNIDFDNISNLPVNLDTDRTDDFNESTTVLGSFTGATITDDTFLTNALQELETAVERAIDPASVTVTYENNASGLNSENVQAALDEINGKVDTNVGSIGTNRTDITTNTTSIGRLETLSGVDGATNLGEFSGSTISDDNNTKEALQELETALEEIIPLSSTKSDPGNLLELTQTGTGSTALFAVNNTNGTAPALQVTSNRGSSSRIASFEQTGLGKGVSINMNSNNEIGLEITNTTKPISIQYNASNGYILTSDASGTGTWQPGFGRRIGTNLDATISLTDKLAEGAAHNILIGNLNGNNLIEGEHNVIIGKSAEIAVSTSNGNISIGHEATSGSANGNTIAIGSSAESTADNTTAIGNGATADAEGAVAIGAGAVASTIDQVTIGSANRPYSLEVTGNLISSPATITITLPNSVINPSRRIIYLKGQGEEVTDINTTDIPDGQELILVALNDNITLSGGGKIHLGDNSVKFDMNTRSTLHLIYVKELDNWVEIGRSR
ncbi:MAG: hypothetical protein AAF620_14135 [Bacteroidota bacterium]